MDTIFKIVGVALITCGAVMVIRPVRGDFAILISIVGGLIILFYTLSYFTNIFDIFNKVIKLTGINSSLYTLIFKIIGIGYLTEFTASICADTGNLSLGDKVILGGKIIILIMALPIVSNILQIVMELLPQ